MYGNRYSKGRSCARSRCLVNLQASIPVSTSHHQIASVLEVKGNKFRIRCACFYGFQALVGREIRSVGSAEIQMHSLKEVLVIGDVICSNCPIRFCVNISEMTFAKRVRASTRVVLINVTCRSSEKKRHAICVTHSKLSFSDWTFPPSICTCRYTEKCIPSLPHCPSNSKDISGNCFNSGILFPSYRDIESELPCRAGFNSNDNEVVYRCRKNFSAKIDISAAIGCLCNTCVPDLTLGDTQ